MEYVGLLILAALVIWALTRNSSGQGDNQTSARDREQHRQDGNSHVYYRREGTLVHESEYCNGCMQNRAEELKRQGYQVEELHLGRHNTGEL